MLWTYRDRTPSSYGVWGIQPVCNGGCKWCLSSLRIDITWLLLNLSYEVFSVLSSRTGSSYRHITTDSCLIPPYRHVFSFDGDSIVFLSLRRTGFCGLAISLSATMLRRVPSYRQNYAHNSPLRHSFAENIPYGSVTYRHSKVVSHHLSPRNRPIPPFGQPGILLGTYQYSPTHHHPTSTLPPLKGGSPEKVLYRV